MPQNQKLQDRAPLLMNAAGSLLSAVLMLIAFLNFPAAAQVLQQFPFAPDAPQPPRAEIVEELDRNSSLLFPPLVKAVPQLETTGRASPLRTVDHTALSVRESAMATAAWAYIERNSDARSGFVNALDQVPQAGLWDIAAALSAISNARMLGVISKRDYDRRAGNIIATLSRLELTELETPNWRYDTRSGRAVTFEGVPGFSGTSAIDAGRLLIWLDRVKRDAPYFAADINRAVARWNFCPLTGDGGQLQFLSLEGGALQSQAADWPGYQQYAGKGFALWGFDADLSAPVTETVSLLAVDLPRPAKDARGFRAVLDFDTFGLDGVEFGWDVADDRASDDRTFTDGWRAELAHRLYQVQERRYLRTNRLTARGPHYGSADGSFIYDGILGPNGAWVTSGLDGRRMPEEAALSTQTAMLMWALWNDAYSRLLFNAVADRFDTERGFPEGIYEDGRGVVEAYSLNANAAVLAALAFRQFGARYPAPSPAEVPFWYQADVSLLEQQSRCLPAASGPVSSAPSCAPSRLAFRYCDEVSLADVTGTCPDCPPAAARCTLESATVLSLGNLHDGPLTVDQAGQVRADCQP